MTYAEDGLSKLQFAKILTAALAYLARKQRDTFGLYAINNAQLTMVQPRFEQQQFMRFLNELILLEARGKWQNNQSIEPLFDHHGKEMIIFITDLYDDANDLQRFISRLKTPRNEVIVFQLMGRKESNFGFDGSYTFEDIETGVRTKAETNVLQNTYAARMNTWLAQTKSWMLEKHLTYHLVYLDEPVDRVLRNFLTVRKTNGTFQNFNFNSISPYVGKVLADKNNQVWVLFPRGNGVLVYKNQLTRTI
jgi:uncharacterized protein (DUF58 family)